MKAQYITTYWQSLALLQAGMDRETSDFVYVRSMEPVPADASYIKDGAIHFEPVYDPRPRSGSDNFNTDVIPAWSLGRLWDYYLEKGWVFEFGTNFSAEEVIQALTDVIIKNSKK